MQVIQKKLKDEGDQEFLKVGKFEKNHTQVADMYVSTYESAQIDIFIRIGYEEQLGENLWDTPSDTAQTFHSASPCWP